MQSGSRSCLQQQFAFVQYFGSSNKTLVSVLLNWLQLIKSPDLIGSIRESYWLGCFCSAVNCTQKEFLYQNDIFRIIFLSLYFVYNFYCFYIFFGFFYSNFFNFFNIIIVLRADYFINFIFLFKLYMNIYVLLILTSCFFYIDLQVFIILP